MLAKEIRLRRRVGRARLLLLVGLGLSACRGDAPAEGAAWVAFVVYDAGETLGLLPVVDKLRAQGIDVRWVPLTPWSADLLVANGQDFLMLPDDIAEMGHVAAREAEADMAYWEEALASHPPALAVSGVVSTVQAQLGRWFEDAGIPARGFHDGFQPPGFESIEAQTASAFQELWAPTTRVRDAFLALGIPAVLAGQPTLEAWRSTSEEVEVDEVRRRLGVGGDERILLFAGQYGPGYEEVLGWFLDGMEAVLRADSSLALILSHHPRTNGEVERRALDRSGLPGPVVAPEGMSTMETAVPAEVIITWTSTVGAQAAFLGKPVVYFSPPPEFDTHLVERGLAFRADEETLGPVLTQALGQVRSPESIRETLVGSGYVLDADSVMADLILKAISG